MAKKEKFLCDKCLFFTGLCTHNSNKVIKVKGRLEQIDYKTTDKKSECEFYECSEN